MNTYRVLSFFNLEGLSETETDSHTSVAVIAGSVAGCVVVIIVLALLIILIYKYRNKGIKRYLVYQSNL